MLVKPFRVIVMLNEASPELMAEMEKVPPRLRAERMRVLATLGLQVARNPGVQFANAVQSSQDKGHALEVEQQPSSIDEDGVGPKIRPPSKRLSNLVRSLSSS